MILYILLFGGFGKWEMPVEEKAKLIEAKKRMDECLVTML